MGYGSFKIIECIGPVFRDRNATLYQSAIVTIAPSCTTAELLDRGRGRPWRRRLEALTTDDNIIRLIRRRIDFFPTTAARQFFDSNCDATDDGHYITSYNRLTRHLEEPVLHPATSLSPESDRLLEENDCRVRWRRTAALVKT